MRTRQGRLRAVGRRLLGRRWIPPEWLDGLARREELERAVGASKPLVADGQQRQDGDRKELVRDGFAWRCVWYAKAANSPTRSARRERNTRLVDGAKSVPPRIQTRETGGAEERVMN